MDRVRRNAWWGSFGLGLVVLLLGVGDLVGGPEFDAASAEAIGGRTIDQLKESDGAWRVIDFGARHGGLDLITLGALIAVLAAIPLRAGAWWAWWTLWLLPAWLVAGYAYTVSYGLAPGTSLPGSTLSGPIIALVAAIVLLLATPRSRTEARAPTV